MKIALNRCFGGYQLKENYYDQLDRDDPELVQYLENHKDNMQEIQENGSNIKVIEFPDESTDWYIDEYDGLEELIYVLNGKLHFI